MKLDDNQIVKFQNIYRKNFGEEIDKESAVSEGLRIIRLVETILKERQRLLPAKAQKINN
jgi:hypothetical protein